MGEVDERRGRSRVALLLGQQDVRAVGAHGRFGEGEREKRQAEERRRQLAYGQHGQAGRKPDAEKDVREAPRRHESRGRKPRERPEHRQQRRDGEVQAVLQLGKPEKRDVDIRSHGDIGHERQVVQPHDAEERREPLVARDHAELLQAARHRTFVALVGGQRFVEQQGQRAADCADAGEHPKRHAPVGHLQNERAHHRRQHRPHHEHHLHERQQRLAPLGHDSVLHHRGGHRAHRARAQRLKHAHHDEHADGGRERACGAGQRVGEDARYEHRFAPVAVAHRTENQQPHGEEQEVSHEREVHHGLGRAEELGHVGHGRRVHVEREGRDKRSYDEQHDKPERPQASLRARKPRMQSHIPISLGTKMPRHARMAA